VRLGVEVDLTRVPLGSVAGIAADVERAGLDLVWFTGDERRAVVAAATCAPRTRWVHIGLDVGCAHHPVYLAEELHVLDQLTGGRLIVAVCDPDPARLAETLTVLRAAGLGPFRHEGPLWTIPAGLPEHTVNPERRVRVTPPPFGPRLELVAGRHDDGIVRLVAPGIALVRLDPAPERLDQLASQVRPRLQLDRLPAGLTDFWDSLTDEAEAER
jgi:hypothetical protein